MLVFLLATLVALQTPSGVITGQVLAVTGKPATKVRVAAMALPEADGTGGGVLASLAETDVEGRYRLEGIPPGRYYIQAGLLDAPSYYPGAGVISGAMPIQVSAGVVVENIDFKMASSAGVRVRGRVPLNANPRPTRVLLSGATSVGAPRNANVIVGADGFFEFTQVLPGKYTLSPGPAGGVPPLPLDVKDEDIDLGLSAGVGVRVSGNVGLGANSPRGVGTRVILSAPNGWSQFEAQTDASGRFEVATVPPATYTIRTIPGSGTVLATLTVADREITALVVPSLVEVTGRVVVEGGRPWVSPSTAIMVEARRNTGETLATVIRPDGTFRLPLTEGIYQIGFGKLPQGLIVRSASYAPTTTDLLQSPLVLDGSAVPGEILLTFARNP